MGLFDWLFGRRAREAPVHGESGSLPLLLRAGEYEFPIVGEAHYQDALTHLAGGKTINGVAIETAAELIAEPDNRHDRNAVMVTIGGLKVGYLSREHASGYLKQMRELGLPPHAICHAQICGGWDRGENDRGHFGVKLDIEWPVDEE